VRYFTLSEDGNRLTLSVKNQTRVTSTLVWNESNSGVSIVAADCRQ
jgi:hypothetical protein